MKTKTLAFRPLASLPLMILLCASSVAMTACATSSNQPTATYSDQVEAAFQRGEQAFKSKDYLEAIRRFNIVRNQFPYSKYAALAELRIGDAYFAQEQFQTAIEQYRSFIQLHPNNENSTYAYYQIALSYYKQMPGDWWFLPPSYEKDLSRPREAIRELRLFLRHFPDSEYAKDAAQKLAVARRRMADHELYVANFYLDRDNPRAAANRLTHLLKNYSGVGLDPTALFLLGRAYLQLGEVDKAIDALTDLVEVHPNSEPAKEAKKYLDRGRS